MRLTQTMKKQLAWRAAHEALERDPTAAPDAVDALASLALSLEPEHELLGDLVAKLSDVARPAVQEATCSAGADAMQTLSDSLAEISDDLSLLARHPAWTPAPMDASASQEALLRASLARQRLAGLMLVAPYLEAVIPAVPTSHDERLARLVANAPPLQSILGALLATTPSGAAPRPWLLAGSAVADSNTTGPEMGGDATARIQAWILARTDADTHQLRLSADEARVLLSTHQGAQLAEFLGGDLDVSADAEAVESSPVSLTDARRAWLEVMAASARVDSSVAQKQASTEQIAMLRAAANHVPALVGGAQALVWGRPLQVWLFPDIGLLVATGLIDAAAPEERPLPALLLVRAAGMAGIEVGGLPVDPGCDSDQALCLHVGDLKQLPSITLAGHSLDGSGAGGESPLLLWRWLDLLRNERLAEAADLLTGLCDAMVAQSPTAALHHTLATLAAELESPASDEG